MNKNLRVLVAEDNPANARLLEVILKREGYQASFAVNGVEALKLLKENPYDILLTDWMMPEMDGIQLIRSVRTDLKLSILVIMITALADPEARSFALQSGADDFIAKPYSSAQVLQTLENGLKRQNQAQPDITGIATTGVKETPLFPAVTIAVSTGGPETLKVLFKNLAPCKAVFLVVQHGPKWMLEGFAKSLQSSCSMPVILAEEGMVPEVGKIYIAPGERHLMIQPKPLLLKLDDGPKVNFVKPSADVLFKSAASVFGKYCLSVVLTGLGRDGTKGAAYVASAGGQIYAQEPDSAVARYMPESVIASGLIVSKFKVNTMGKSIEKLIANYSDQIK